MPRSYNFLPKRQGAVELFWGKGSFRKGKGALCSQRGKEGARLRPRMRADTAVGRRAEGTAKCKGQLWAQKRSTLHWPSQRAATGGAGRCDGRCTALHRTGQQHKGLRTGLCTAPGKGRGERPQGQGGEVPKAVHQACCCRRRCPTAGKASERKPSRGSTMRTARRGRMGQRHEAQGSGVACRWGQGHLRGRLLAGCFQRAPTGKGGIPDALPERAAVISEGKRGLQSMYVGCQL